MTGHGMPNKLGKGVVALLVLSTLCGFLAFVSIWADRQLLQTDHWTDTSTQLLERPAVRDAVSAYLVDQLFSNVDVSGQLRQYLPADFKGLAAPAAAGMRQVASQAADKALVNPRVQALWRDANRKAHASLMKILDGGSEAITIAGGEVTLNTRLLLSDLANQLGIGQKVVSKLPPGVGKLVVMRSSALRSAQFAAKAVRGFALVFTILTFVLFATAIWLASGRRRKALAFSGGAFVLVGGLALLLIKMAEGPVVDGLASTATVRPAVRDVFSVSTSLLREQAVSVLITGILVMFAAWIAGPSRPALGFRRGVAPYLRENLPAAIAVAVFLFLLLIWWAPTLGFQTATGILLNALLAIAGFTALTMLTRREFPDAQPGEFSTLTGSARGHWHSLRSGSDHAATGESKHSGNDPGARFDEIERLAALHDRGVLTDEEFADQKSKLLG